MKLVIVLFLMLVFDLKDQAFALVYGGKKMHDDKEQRKQETNVAATRIQRGKMK